MECDYLIYLYMTVTPIYHHDHGNWNLTNSFFWNDFGTLLYRLYRKPTYPTKNMLVFVVFSGFPFQNGPFSSAFTPSAGLHRCRRKRMPPTLNKLPKIGSWTWTCVRGISRWWQLKYIKYFLMFTPIPGEDEPNLTSIFFKWVETTNYTPPKTNG